MLANSHCQLNPVIHSHIHIQIKLYQYTVIMHARNINCQVTILINRDCTGRKLSLYAQKLKNYSTSYINVQCMEAGELLYVQCKSQAAIIKHKQVNYDGLNIVISKIRLVFSCLHGPNMARSTHTLQTARVKWLQFLERKMVVTRQQMNQYTCKQLLLLV